MIALGSLTGGEAAASPRIALVTIGQAPRDDIVPDIRRMVGQPLAVDQFGALDGLDDADLASLAPRASDLSLYTRLTDGRHIVVGAPAIEARVADLCAHLDDHGYAALVIASTGLFQDVATVTPLVHGQRVIDTWIDALVMAENSIGLIYPLEQQRSEARYLHGVAAENRRTCVISGETDHIERAALRLRDCDLIVLHSVAYTEGIAKRVSAVTGKPVVTARRVLAGALRFHLGSLAERGLADAELPPHLASALTRREQQVTTLVVNGLSNKEIGRELGISHRTVEIHRARAMNKLGVTTIPGLMRQVLAR